jgi:hypothetical protein
MIKVQEVFNKVKITGATDLHPHTIQTICSDITEYSRLWKTHSAAEEFLIDIMTDRKCARSIIGGAAYIEITNKIGYSWGNPNINKIYNDDN